MLQIQMFGALNFNINGTAIPSVSGIRGQSILAKLLLDYPVAVKRTTLASLLWPSSSEKQARTNLRREIHTLRQVHPLFDNSINTSHHALSWAPVQDLEIDVLTFRVQYDLFLVKSASIERFEIAESALKLYGGDLIPEIQDDWLAQERENLRQNWLTLADEYIPHLNQKNRLGEGIDLSRRVILQDPFRESAYLHLMQLYLRSGNTALAMHVYHQCESTLVTELGISPGPKLAQLHTRLLRTTRATLLPETNPPGTVAIGNLKGLTPFVGREEIIRKITGHLTMAGDTSAQLILVSGEAGIGKTRLCEQVLKSPGVVDKIFGRTRCYAAEGAEPLNPIASLLRTDPLRRLVSQLGAIWANELYATFPELIPASSNSLKFKSSDERSRNRLFEAISQAVTLTPVTESYQNRQIRVLFLDDIQWCDLDTLEWLRHLFHFECQVKIIILATMRSEAVGDSKNVESLATQLLANDQLKKYELEPLSRASSLLLMNLELSLSNSIDFNKIDMEKITLNAEGNPLYLIEMIRFYLQQASSNTYSEKRSSKPASEDEPELVLPPKVHAIIQQRFERLTIEAQNVVAVAAVVGRRFSVSMLQLVCNLKEIELVDALDQLWRFKLIRETPNGEYDFTHDCVREAGYRSISVPKRQYIHGRVSQVLESIVQHDLDSVSAKIAVHSEKAGQYARAAIWYRRALEHARESLAFNDVLEYSDSLLKLFASIDPNGLQVDERLQVLCIKTYIVSLLNGFGSPKLIPLCNELEQLCRLSNNHSLRFSAVNRSRVYYSFSNNPAKALEFTLKKISIARESGEPGLLIEAHRSKAFVEFQLGHFVACGKTANEGCEVAAELESKEFLDSSNPSWSLVMLSAIKAWVQYVKGRPIVARHAFAGCHSSEFDGGDKHTQGLVLFWIAMVHVVFNQAEEARSVGTHLISIGEKTYLEKLICMGNAYCGWAAYKQGRFTESIDIFENVLHRYQHLNENIMDPMWKLWLAEAKLSADQLEDASVCVRSAIAHAKMTNSPTWNAELYRNHALVSAQLGDPVPVVLRYFKMSENIATAQNAALFRLRSLQSEYKYRIHKELDTRQTAETLSKLVASLQPHGSSDELVQASATLNLEIDLVHSQDPVLL